MRGERWCGRGSLEARGGVGVRGEMREARSGRRSEARCGRGRREARGAVGIGGEMREARSGRRRRDARGEEWAWEARGAASCGRGSGVVRNVGRLFID